METDLSWRLSDNGVAEHFTAFENILNIASVFFELIENEVLQVSSSCMLEPRMKPNVQRVIINIGQVRQLRQYILLVIIKNKYKI